MAEFWEIYQNIHLFIEILVCVAFLEHSKYSKGAFDKEVARLSAAFPDEPNDHDMYCTILMILLETFLQYKRPVDDLADILRELKFKEECVEDLAKVMISNQQSLTEQFHEMKTPKPLEKFQYKINISLMERWDTFLLEVFKVLNLFNFSGQPPTVILHQEHEGETKTFNLSLKQFHRLRLGVASSLAEIQSLETKRS